MNIAEAHWIGVYETMSPIGYNLREGGDSGGLLSEETKARLSASKRGRSQSPEIIERRIAPLRGRSRSEAARKAISAGLQGRPVTWGHKTSETRKRLGIRLSPDQRAAFISAGRKAQRELREQGLLSVAADKNPNAKLNWEKVREIRRLWATGEYSQQELADLFAVKQVAISRIVRGVTWTE